MSVVAKFCHVQLDAPDQTCQSTQKEKTPFRLETLVWCRPKTIRRENQYVIGMADWAEEN